ncbi:YfjP family GTPase [Streptomyces sp. NPDC052496]|uniref:YfjP family GTPase n=1 Tax=Streptomyces sp. NPDC052496 TaxID=3154951 RepID=UPI0034257F0A
MDPATDVGADSGTDAGTDPGTDAGAVSITDTGTDAVLCTDAVLRTETVLRTEADAPRPSSASSPAPPPPPAEARTSWNDGLIARRAQEGADAKPASGRRHARAREAAAEPREGRQPEWREWPEWLEWEDRDRGPHQGEEDGWLDGDEWHQQRDWQEWEDEGDSELEAVLAVLQEPAAPVQEPRSRRERAQEAKECAPAPALRPTKERSGPGAPRGLRSTRTPRSSKTSRAFEASGPSGSAGPSGSSGPFEPSGLSGPSRDRRSARQRLRPRLDALRELVGLSRTRLDEATLAEAGRVLGAADERYRLSGEHTVVAVAGATGSGKSSLFNALVGADLSDVAARRPTTSEPVACVWAGGQPGAHALLDRLGVPVRRRHTPAGGAAVLPGLVLLDLPDHDSAATGHREQVDRMLELVDAVIWVVDPEKYADAVLHERYLRPLAGHAEVMFVVLNQVDRLPGDAAVQVVDDLRRLLDEDGLALGEHGEPGAAVLALSAATGEGVGELKEALRQFVAERGAPDRRLAADVEAAAGRLRPVYVADGRYGLTEAAREEFEDWLAEAVGAGAMGSAAERDWLRHGERACGTPWLRLRLRGRRPGTGCGRSGRTSPGRTGPSKLWHRDAYTEADAESEADVEAGAAGDVSGEACGDGAYGTVSGWVPVDGRATARPLVEQAVRAVAGEASEGLPAPWAQAVREAAVRGAEELPEALDRAAAVSEGALRAGPQVRPRWWTAASVLQGLLTMAQITGLLWLLAVMVGAAETEEWLSALLVTAIGTAGGPALSWVCGVAGRGAARRYGQEAERRLRTAAAGCGRAAVLEPVAAELLRYREVREQYAVAAGL